MYRVLGLLLVCVGLARGQGRAFPVDGENYAIEAFQRINRFIEWDKTNFLVDLSGEYADCDNIKFNRQGFIDVDRTTPDGVSIAAYVDDTEGSASDVNAVNRYISTVIDSWTRSQYGEIYNQIQSADKFGCSVRPKCAGRGTDRDYRVSVACLFSPGSGGGYRPPNIEEASQNAVAFTDDQYEVAEMVTHEKWDSNHFLENLSGFETSCAMITQNDLPFAHSSSVAKERGRKVQMLYEVAENRGETEPAMIEALQNMKRMDNVEKVGCSLIPDCIEGNKMYVVVGCLFQLS